MMARKLKITGLVLMLLGAIIAIVYAFILMFVYAASPRFDVPTFLIFVLPAIFITGIAWLNPFLGGYIAGILSVITLTIGFITLHTNLDTKADFFWFAITICYLLGSVLLLIGDGMSRRHRRDSRAANKFNNIVDYWRGY